MTYQMQTDTYSKKVNRKKRKKKKSSHFLRYLYLFSFVFLAALSGLSYIIKTYSPDIDVTIGNKENFILYDTEADIESKPVDERLKWIQMEDDLPTVSIRGIDKIEKDKERKLKKMQEEKELQEVKPPIPSIAEIKEQAVKNKQSEFSIIPTKDVISTVNHTITKVYLGNYPTVEAAEEVKKNIEEIEPSISPFIKSVNGHYIVQLGSFADGNKAGALASKLREKGYYPKVNYEN